MCSQKFLRSVIESENVARSWNNAWSLFNKNNYDGNWLTKRAKSEWARSFYWFIYWRDRENVCGSRYLVMEDLLLMHVTVYYWNDVALRNEECEEIWCNIWSRSDIAVWCWQSWQCLVLNRQKVCRHDKLTALRTFGICFKTGSVLVGHDEEFVELFRKNR